MLSDLIGKEVRIIVDEGSGPLAQPALELVGVVSELSPKGPAWQTGIMVRVLEPPTEEFRASHVILMNRHEGTVLEDALRGKTVIVNIELVRKDRGGGMGIGALEGVTRN